MTNTPDALAAALACFTNGGGLDPEDVSYLYQQGGVLAAAVRSLQADLDQLRSLADAAAADGCRPVSFPALCDSIDSKDTEDQVYTLVMYHVRRRERAEAALTALTGRTCEAIEQAYHEGWSRGMKPPYVAPDDAWAKSTALRTATGLMTPAEWQARRRAAKEPTP
jgi:hypothetical protein